MVNKAGEYKQIENQIRNDRDRNFFGDKLMASFYSVLAKSQLRYDIQGMRMLVERAHPCWNQGHPLIAAIANASLPWDQATLDSVFHGKYFARSFACDAATQLDYQQLERRWQHQGLQALPAYFASFGLPNAEQHLRDLQEKVRARSRIAPTPAETSCIQMLRETLRELKPEIMSFFDAATRRTPSQTPRLLLGSSGKITITIPVRYAWLVNCSCQTSLKHSLSLFTSTPMFLGTMVAADSPMRSQDYWRRWFSIAGTLTPMNPAGWCSGNW